MWITLNCGYGRLPPLFCDLLIIKPGVIFHYVFILIWSCTHGCIKNSSTAKSYSPWGLPATILILIGQKTRKEISKDVLLRRWSLRDRSFLKRLWSPVLPVQRWLHAFFSIFFFYTYTSATHSKRVRGPLLGRDPRVENHCSKGLLPSILKQYKNNMLHFQWINHRISAV